MVTSVVNRVRLYCY